MKIVSYVLLSVCLILGSNVYAEDNVPASKPPVVEKKQELSKYLQDISVTIQTNKGSGSGVIVTREIAGEKVNFVWTAAHVVDSLRKVRTVIDPNSGTEKQVVEFDDASIVKELVEDGRRVGELKMDAKVIKFSNYNNGEDLALLEMRKKDFVSASARFYLGDDIPSIGTHLVHVGSLLGQMGSNSMTTGIVSQIGRIVDNKVFDQTTVTAFPGSSGGGVFFEGKHDSGEYAGQYMGMLVRGAGETFNLVVPARRMKTWAKHANVEWAMNPDVPAPSSEDREKIKVEDIGVSFSTPKEKGRAEAILPIPTSKSFFESLIKTPDRPCKLDCKVKNCKCESTNKCDCVDKKN